MILSTLTRRMLNLRKWLIVFLFIPLIVMSGSLQYAEATSVYQNIGSFTEYNGVPISRASGIAIDSNGNIYVTDENNKRIVIFNEDGTSIGEIPVGYDNLGLIRIKDKILYVVIHSTNIYRFDLNNNYEQIGDRYNIPYGNISGLAIDSQGNIFANTKHHLLKITPDGDISVYFNYYDDFGGSSSFLDSRGIAFDEDDNLFVLSHSDFIHRWDKNKNYLGVWQYDFNHERRGLFYHKGHLYVTNHQSYTRGFQKISATSGEILSTFKESANYYESRDIAVHPLTDRLYVLYSGTSSGVWVYKDNGTTITLHVNSNEVQYGDDVTISVSVSGNDYAAPVPTGVIHIKDGPDELMELDLINGEATFTTSSLLPGDRKLRAVYSGDHNYHENSSEEIQLKINKMPSTVNLQTSNPNISLGESVTFTATVTGIKSGAEIPSGTVTFLDDGEVLAVETLVDGIASLDVSNLAMGQHTITAHYSGDHIFLESDDLLQQVVDKMSTVTSVSATPSTSKFGETVAITATVAATNPIDHLPTGTVRFMNGAIELGTEVLDNGSASLDVSNLLIGDHTITVEYEGDSTYSASSDQMIITVEKASTTTKVTTSEALSSYGEDVTFTATVTANAPGSGTPTGTVTFKDGDDVLGTATLSDGIAILSEVNNLAVGTHTITAEYSGDSSFLPSSNSIVQTITFANVMLNTTTSKMVSRFGEEVTFTTNVTSENSLIDQPSGEVTFIFDDVELGKATLMDGAATITIRDLPVGEHSITIIYSGDPIYSSKNDAVQHTVNKANTTINVTTSNANSIYGEGVTFTAVVTAESPGSGVPSGSVTFMKDSEVIGTVTLTDGMASLTLSTLPVGAYEITVQYNGDPSFLSSNATIDQEVEKASTTTSIVSSVSSSVSGESVALTATVDTLDKGTPTGIVIFMNGMEKLGEVTLNDGVATLSGINNLSVGEHTITANYSGDSTFSPSSGIIQHTVNKAITTSNITLEKTTLLQGESVTLTANVKVNHPGNGFPTGKVTFLHEDDDLGEVNLTSADDGVATLIISEGLNVGNYEIYVQYEGDESFLPSKSDSVTLTISRRSSGGSPSPPEPIQPQPVVGTDGKIILPPRAPGLVSLGDSIQVTLPENFSDDEVHLTIEKLVENVPVNDEDDELLSDVYEILSNLTGTFSREITITIVFDPTKLKPGEKAVIFYFDEENEEWIEVGGVVDGNKVSVKIDHLTKFAVFARDSLSDIHGHWATSNIVKAVESGIVNGYPDGTFRPNQPVTRAEFTVMLMNGLQLDIDSSHMNFTDRNQIGAWATQAISQAVQSGVVHGYEDGSFRPNEYINRTEMVVMIANALNIHPENIPETSFSDDENIPSWAKGSVEAIRNLGIVNGRSKDQFAPKENATRAEAITIILNMLEHK